MRIVTVAALLPVLFLTSPAAAHPLDDLPGPVLLYADCADILGVKMARKHATARQIWDRVMKVCAEPMSKVRQYEEEMDAVNKDMENTWLKNGMIPKYR